MRRRGAHDVMHDWRRRLSTLPAARRVRCA